MSRGTREVESRFGVHQASDPGGRIPWSVISLSVSCVYLHIKGIAVSFF